MKARRREGARALLDGQGAEAAGGEGAARAAGREAAAPDGAEG